MSDPRLTFPLTLIQRSMTLGVLTSVISAVMTPKEATDSDVTMQQLAGDIVDSAILRSKGHKGIAFMAVLTATLELWWRIMSERVDP
jgi:hypothetical protein